MTLVVLGLDALDSTQVEYFGMEEYMLNTHGKMETFAYQNPIPHTGEVWPSVATGLHPRDHGITHGGESKWDTWWAEYASLAVGKFIPMKKRAKLGRIIRQYTSADWEINEADDPTFFDGEARYCHNWPGTINGNEVRKVWRHINHTVNKGEVQEDFDKRLLGTGASKFAWIEEMLNHNCVLVGSHIHVLDASGHAYGTNEDHYRGFYKWSSEWIRRVKDTMDEDDEMLILSDHGMNTSWLPIDEELCHHSWRAYSASTTGDRPETVFGVKDWVENNIRKHERKYRQQKEETELNMPEETLRDLGYIS